MESNYMTPESQRIAIAEACGWKSPNHADSIALVKDWTFSKNRKLWWINPVGEPKWLSDVPDYLNDLNAMHEAEKVLGGNQPLIYLNFLSEVVGWRGDEISPEGYTCHTIELFWFATATAAQRAEAFLRTLNLWTE